MTTRYTAKQLAEVSEMLRYERHRRGSRPEDVLEFEYHKGALVGILKQVRFGRSATSGKPTKKTIECVDNGTERCYDGNYDFEISDFIVKGQRIGRL